jgi:hypothetical protein
MSMKKAKGPPSTSSTPGRARLPGKPSRSQKALPALSPEPQQQVQRPPPEPLQPDLQPQEESQPPPQEQPQAPPQPAPQQQSQQEPQQPPLPSPQEHSELAQHLLDLAKDEPDPDLRLRLNQLAALNAAFGLQGQSPSQPPTSAEPSAAS